MNCQEVHALIPAYFQGQVDEYTKIKVHHHLARCTSCTEDFEMWQRGDELIQTPQEIRLEQGASSQKLVMNQVMQRIKHEEKWANPSMKSESTNKRTSKRALMLVACTLMLFFVILVTSTFMPQKEVLTGGETPQIMEQVEASWEQNTVVLSERTIDQETSMYFQVASFYDPLIYALPVEESKSDGRLLIFSVFGLLCIIISLNWITRV